MADKKYLDQNGLSHLKSKMDLTYAKKEEVGVTDYNSLSGLPTLDGTEIKGTMTKEGLGIASKGDIPTNNNELTNGAGYQTASDVEGILATKDYQTEEDVESIVTGKDYQTSTQVESAITEKGYQTSEQVETAITKKGYQTASDVEEKITSKGYQTETEVTTAINKAVADINKKQIVTSTEEMTDENIIYLIKNQGEEDNIYDEYIVVSGKPEKVGTTKVDLTGYLREKDLTVLSNDEIDAIFNS